MNRIDQLFAEKKGAVLNIFCTAGFPALNDTRAVLRALQSNGADMIELGIPFSDPLADGPVIQQSNNRALENGMTLEVLFGQLKDFRKEIRLPLILMGDLNPVMQFGLERFLQQCRQEGVDGVILPNMPLVAYEREYRSLFGQYGIYAIFLVTPETSEERIRKIDALSRGFIYAVSSSSTTGKDKNLAGQQDYFKRLAGMKLKNPVLVGFGIRDKASFEEACRHTQGAVIGTAYVRALEEKEVEPATKEFIGKIRGI